MVIVRDKEHRFAGGRKGKRQDAVYVFTQRGGRRQNINPYDLGKSSGIDNLSLPLSIIDPVYKGDHRLGIFCHLREQVQVSLELCRIEDCDDNIRPLLFEETPDQHLLFRVAVKRVNPGEVDEFDLLFFVADVAALERDRGARIFVHFNAKTCQLVEDQGFSYSRIPQKCDLHQPRSTKIADAISGLSATSQAFTCTTSDRLDSFRLIDTCCPGTTPRSRRRFAHDRPEIARTTTRSPSSQSASVRDMPSGSLVLQEE